ncbi:hypothetical protein HG536_0D03180 [Torulaspora globosa]|uniref:Ca3427-like PBP 2 domain-containing protein n=1 Tax=Torulaspora globosa TaxID=48254 RepID=A0A7G3ZH10_9SACH|nr:uncharacterized protein HG536_0D03180 [Torulaspora globosa]QLL32796.1 hypothetical protein HG536_0D03180 [Torulaspora globosa]
MTPLRVGYVPEHFSTPLQFAQKHGFFSRQGLQITLIPYPSGTGHMISSLNSQELDVAIGLTEAFVRGLLADPAQPPSYEIVSTYVSSPLNWAVSTGVNRDDVTELSQLEGAKIGVSRIGSGSYVMSYVLAQQQRFERDPPFADWPVCDTFEGLRRAVNSGQCDAFMWEYFTTRAHYEGPHRDLKMIGNILTPWASWVVVKNTKIGRETMDRFQAAVRDGIEYFENHTEEAIQYISQQLPYSEQDARDWLETVEFEVGDSRDPMEKAERVLRVCGVLPGRTENAEATPGSQ